MRRTIGDIAAFVTSKNAGPFLLTLDIAFPDRATYERFKALKALDRVTVAGLYGVMAEDVLKIIEFDPRTWRGTSGTRTCRARPREGVRPQRGGQTVLSYMASR